MTKCDPTWNHPARWLLVYALPLAMLAVCLERGWVGASRDFWVPFVWGLVVPALNTSRWGGKAWVLKDFMQRDKFPPSMALVHAGFWCLAVNLTGSAPASIAIFVVAFLAFDAVMIHRGILRVLALPLAVHRRGTLAVLLGFGPAWWLYVGSGFAAAHVWGSDGAGPILLASAAMILPAQAVLTWLRLGPARPERFAVRRVAVVGAGFSGAYATKWLSELGLEVTCFEASEAIGGVWRFKRDGGGVFEQTRATSSAHFLHPMDFPLPAGTPDFPHHTQLLAHLNAYVDHFGIRDRFRLKTRVVCARKSDGSWLVETRGPDGARSEECFDAVVVCSGPQGKPRLDTATDPLYSRFTGAVTHASEYKTPADYPPGERVLVLGAGESAADIVHECADGGLKVHWSTHRGQWFADRNIGPFAADHFTAVGVRALFGRYLNVEYLVRRFIIANFINLAWGQGGHGIPAWVPETPYLHQFLNKSRDGILEIYRGVVKAHGRVAEVDGRFVRFEGESEPVEFDRIIFATGYVPHWPFLERRPSLLYRKVFDPADPTLAFIGLARPVLGSITGLAEMQTRWVANVFAGRATLPCGFRRELIAWLDARDQPRRFHDSSPLGVLCDHEVYATELATEIGAHVRWLRLLLTDFRGFRAVFRSPWIAFKYMVHDPDPVKRRQAVDNVLREMPDPAHPAFLINRVFHFMVPLFFLTFAWLLWRFPLYQVAAGTALFIVLSELFFRVTELAEQRTARRMAAGAVAGPPGREPAAGHPRPVPKAEPAPAATSLAGAVDELTEEPALLEG